MTQTAAPRPLPKPQKHSQEFWDATKRGELLAQKCNACSALIMYPKRWCPKCMSEDLGWIQTAGKGEIYSLTVQHAGPPSGFEAMIPYALIVVRLDEGVQLMSNLVGPGALDAKCGDRVAVEYQKINDDVTLPVFHLDA